MPTILARAGRKYRRTYVVNHGDLISKPSYAPLAAVWLIMAMLFIAAYRTPTHAIVIDLPVPSWQDEPTPQIDMKVNVVRLTPMGEITWNGQAVDHDALIRYAEASLEEPVTPLLIFEPDPNAGYNFSAQVLAILHATGLTRHHFCFGGIAQHRRFGEPPGNGSAHPILASVQFSNLPPITDQAECDTAYKLLRS